MEKFEKPPKTNDELVAQLVSRKLRIDNPDRVKEYLGHIGYYRLSGYMYPFLIKDGSKNFKEGINFTQILDHYIFDKKLRFILLDMCERIEVSIRATICNVMALKHGPHWYMTSSHFRSYEHHQTFLSELKEYCLECHDPFIKHYTNKYNDPELPPIWMIVQILTFGQLSRLYDNLKASPERSEIAYTYGTTPKFFESWLRSFNFIRNSCAHHARTWNRHVPPKPIIPVDEKYRFLSAINDDTNKKMFGTISCMLMVLLKVNPKASCRRRLVDLFQEYPSVDLINMGFPGNWQQEKIWTLE